MAVRSRKPTRGGAAPDERRREAGPQEAGPQEAGPQEAGPQEALAGPAAAQAVADPRLAGQGSLPSRMQLMRGLQRTNGNGYAQRLVAGRGELVQRDPIGSWLSTLGHDVAEGIGLEDSFDANLGRAEAFRDHGLYGPENLAINGGGFEASYDPAVGALRIKLRAVVEFKDALTVTGGTVTPAHPGMTRLVNVFNGLPAAQRAAFLAAHQWQDAEKIPWMNQMESSVQGAWGGQHQFFLNRPQWEWLGARVQVDVEVREGTREADDHLAVTSVKMPPDENMFTAGYQSETAPGTGSAFDQSMLVASTDFGPRPDTNFLRETVLFDHNDDHIRPDQQATLDRVATRFLEAFDSTTGALDPRSRGAQIELVAHASSPGDPAYNLDLANRRAEAVRAYLVGKGFTNIATRTHTDNRGESEADPAAATIVDQQRDRRVDLIIDSGERQVVGNHEFGHAFGLGDEYSTDGISGTGSPTGTSASHDGLVRDMTDASGAHLPGAINQNNDNIMSLGNAVQPQHYATFHEALQQITGVDEWSLGAPRPFPTRPPSGGTTGP